MLCPHCNAEIPDDASICAFCDAILDEAFLSGAPITAPGERPAPPPPFMTQDAVGAPPGPPPLVDPPPLAAQAPPQTSPPPPTLQETGGAQDGTSILRMDPEQHKETRIVHMDELGARRNPAEKAALAARGREIGTVEGSELDDLWGQVGLAYRRLRPLEKAALFAIGALVLGAFLPWYSPKGRESISGIEVSGWLTALLGCGALVAFWVRVTLRVVLLVLLQVALIVGAALVAGHALMNPGDKGISFGIYFTLLAGGSASLISLVAAVKT